MEAFDPGVTIALITYNSAAYIQECLHSVRAAAPGVRVLIVDNASTDGTVEIVRRHFPEYTLIALPQNIGHSAACNLALQHTETAWVLFLDHDTIVPADWLQPLLETAAAMWPAVGMVGSRAVLVEQGRIHHDGGYAHYVGHMTLRNGFAPLADVPCDTTPVEVGAQASTSLLVHRERALAVGGFDPRFFIYLNDFDLSLRMRLRGWRCYVAPRSVVYHRQGNPETSWRGSGGYPERRAYLIYRNRWMLIARIYAPRTILVCLPALAIYEIVIAAAALRKGWMRAYRRALHDIVRLWPILRFHRSRIQSSRRLSDRELLSAYGFSYVPGLLQHPAERLMQQALERALAAYWRLVCPLLE
ncbi:MAG: glycosyltransferase family 2 protein [Roseiflexaceae bacterium]|nr:glycosyltransferase family 2 protein [Roseiflexaceae bacterium]